MNKPPSIFVPILFAAITAVCWGLYGPAVSKARTSIKPPEGWSSFKPYLFIGVAYLVWGCLGGAAGMKAFGDTFSFSGEHQKAAVWGFLGGSLGAFGALSLTFALMKAIQHGGPALVMPIVFGGAVTVSAIASLLLNKNAHVEWPMWLGMALVFAGIVLVAKFTPHAAPPGGPKPAASTSTEPAPNSAESK